MMMMLCDKLCDLFLKRIHTSGKSLRKITYQADQFKVEEKSSRLICVYLYNFMNHFTITSTVYCKTTCCFLLIFFFIKNF